MRWLISGLLIKGLGLGLVRRAAIRGFFAFGGGISLFLRLGPFLVFLLVY